MFFFWSNRTNESLKYYWDMTMNGTSTGWTIPSWNPVFPQWHIKLMRVRKIFRLIQSIFTAFTLMRSGGAFVVGLDKITQHMWCQQQDIQKKNDCVLFLNVEQAKNYFSEWRVFKETSMEVSASHTVSGKSLSFCFWYHQTRTKCSVSYSHSFNRDVEEWKSLYKFVSELKE